MSPSLATWIATFGRVGFARKAPGTWGSLAAMPVGYGLLWLGGFPLLAIATLAAAYIGIKAADVYEAHTQKHDPKEIVIDEVVGMWIAMLGLMITASIFVLNATAKIPAHSPSALDIIADMLRLRSIAWDQILEIQHWVSVAFWLVAFVLFRFFDIVKPWPVGWADKKLQGGFGTMMDDVLAGLIAALIPLIACLWMFA